VIFCPSVNLGFIDHKVYYESGKPPAFLFNSWFHLLEDRQRSSDDYGQERYSELLEQTGVAEK
jgi:hypothetical protein